MAAKFPAARLFWIMGGDHWRALPAWEHPDRLAAAVEFAVLPRGGPAPEPRSGFRLHVIDGGHPASATAVRDALGAGNEPRFLDPEVADWIGRRRIYRADRSPRSGGTCPPVRMGRQ
jgi:nicotinate-nucleotide adenylyltransferase